MKLFKNWKKLIKMVAIILLIITMFNFLCTSGLVYAKDDGTNYICSGQEQEQGELKSKFY